jgi:hypothetical protein
VIFKIITLNRHTNDCALKQYEEDVVSWMPRKEVK